MYLEGVSGTSKGGCVYCCTLHVWPFLRWQMSNVCIRVSTCLKYKLYISYIYTCSVFTATIVSDAMHVEWDDIMKFWIQEFKTFLWVPCPLYISKSSISKLSFFKFSLYITCHLFASRFSDVRVVPIFCFFFWFRPNVVDKTILTSWSRLVPGMVYNSYLIETIFLAERSKFVVFLKIKQKGTAVRAALFQRFPTHPWPLL